MALAAGLRALRGGCGRGFGCRCSRCCCWVWPDSAAGWPTTGRMTWPRMAWPLPAVSAFRAETCQRWRCCRQAQPHRRPHPRRRQPLRLCRHQRQPLRRRRRRHADAVARLTDLRPPSPALASRAATPTPTPTPTPTVARLTDLRPPSPALVSRAATPTPTPTPTPTVAPTPPALVSRAATPTPTPTPRRRR